MSLRPYGKAQVKGTFDGENNISDDPPREGIQEEKHNIHGIRDGQGESDLISADSVTEVPVARLHLHSDHGIHRLSEGEFGTNETR